MNNRDIIFQLRNLVSKIVSKNEGSIEDIIIFAQNYVNSAELISSALLKITFNVTFFCIWFIWDKEPLGFIGLRVF